jgi:uncharacterized metal-binding protein YceD (DUF177 family)
MDWKKEYDIEFRGLKEGLHKFEFSVQDRFFEHFEHGLVRVGKVLVKVQLEKRSTFLKLYLNLKGWVELTCDRCLESYRQQIKNKGDLIVKFGENETDDDEIFWVSPEDHRINLAQLIYEYIVLSIPIKQVHPDAKGVSGCNADMLAALKRYEKIETDEEYTDPRWSQLKNWNNN